LKGSLISIVLFLPLIYSIGYQSSEYRNLLIYTDTKSLVIVFSLLNLAFMMSLLLIRKKRVLRFFLSLALSLSVLPLMLPLAKWGGRLQELKSVMTVRYECPTHQRNNSAFDFNFSSQFRKNVSMKTSDEKSKDADYDKDKPCLGRYLNEPFLGYLKRRSEIGILEIVHKVKSFAYKEYLIAQLYRLKSAYHGVWRKDIDGKYLRPNVLVLHESTISKGEINKSMNYLFRKGDVIDSVLLDKNIKIVETSSGCSRSEKLKVEVEKSLQLKQLSERCTKWTHSGLVRKCYERLINGDHDPLCTYDLTNQTAVKMSFQHNREGLCDSDSLARNQLIICLSTKKGNDTDEFIVQGRTYKVNLLKVLDSQESITQKLREKIFNIDSVKLTESSLLTGSILDLYDGLGVTANVEKQSSHFHYINEYHDLMKIRKAFLQRYSGVLNE
jgi:hypothetical protein